MMKNSCFLLLLLAYSILKSQTKTETIHHDTFPDFRNGLSYINGESCDGRFVHGTGQMLYYKYCFRETNQPCLEYFRINDTVFYCYRYAADSSYKEYGKYAVTNNIAFRDTQLTQDINSGTLDTIIIHRNEILKTGNWIEYVKSAKYGEYWEGQYMIGKRVGIWKHILYHWNDRFELELINYDVDSTKVVYEKNVAFALPTDSLKRILYGRWKFFCTEKPYTTIYFGKCGVYDGHYGDDCNDKYSKGNYFEFAPFKIFNRSPSPGCNKYKAKLLQGDWEIEIKDNYAFIVIKFKDSKEVWKFKITYLDREGNLVAEKQQ